MPFDPDIVYHGESRALERTVRAAFGGAFGILPGLWIVAELGEISAHAVAAIVGVAIVSCAVLAMRYGDAFWHAAAKAIRAMF